VTSSPSGRTGTRYAPRPRQPPPAQGHCARPRSSTRTASAGSSS
jgi:hypothetical protein